MSVLIIDPITASLSSTAKHLPVPVRPELVEGLFFRLSPEKKGRCFDFAQHKREIGNARSARHLDPAYMSCVPATPSVRFGRSR
tara:strand:+ start:51 stop:302 length:252 start_codon:yes stop_codon:yes gene_type:complete